VKTSLTQPSNNIRVSGDTFSNDIADNEVEQLAINGKLDYVFEHGGALSSQFFWSVNDNKSELLSRDNVFPNTVEDEIAERLSSNESDTYSIAFTYDNELANGSWSADLSYSQSDYLDNTNERSERRGNANRPFPTLERLNGLDLKNTASTESERTEIVLGVDIDWSFNDRHKLLAGIDLERSENLGDENTDSLLVSVAAFLRGPDASVYFEYEFKLLDNLAFNIGNRFEKDDSKIESSSLRAPATERSISNLSGGSTTHTPSVLAKWSISDTQALRLTWFSAVDKPDLDQLGVLDITSFPEFNFLSYGLGNPELEDSETTTVELGFDWRIDENSVFGITAYRKNVFDEITLLNQASRIARNRNRFLAVFPHLEESLELIEIEDQDAEYSTYFNSESELRVTGVELDLSMPLTVIGLPDLTLQTNVTYLEEETLIPSTNQSATTYQASYNITLDYQYDTWGLGLSYNDIGDDEDIIENLGFQIDEEIRDPSFDVFVKKDFEAFSVNLAVENILDAKETDISRSSETLDGPANEASFQERKLGPQYILSVRGTF